MSKSYVGPHIEGHISELATILSHCIWDCDSKVIVITHKNHVCVEITYTERKKENIINGHSRCGNAHLPNEEKIITLFGTLSNIKIGPEIFYAKGSLFEKPNDLYDVMKLAKILPLNYIDRKFVFHNLVDRTHKFTDDKGSREREKQLIEFKKLL